MALAGPREQRAVGDAGRRPMRAGMRPHGSGRSGWGEVLSSSGDFLPRGDNDSHNFHKGGLAARCAYGVMLQNLTERSGRRNSQSNTEGGEGPGRRRKRRIGPRELETGPHTDRICDTPNREEGRPSWEIGSRQQWSERNPTPEVPRSVARDERRVAGRPPQRKALCAPLRTQRLARAGARLRRARHEQRSPQREQRCGGLEAKA